MLFDDINGASKQDLLSFLYTKLIENMLRLLLLEVVACLRNTLTLPQSSPVSTLTLVSFAFVKTSLLFCSSCLAELLITLLLSTRTTA